MLLVSRAVSHCFGIINIPVILQGQPKPSAFTPQPSTGGFGGFGQTQQPAVPQASTGLFGNTNNATTTPGTGLFGQTTNTQPSTGCKYPQTSYRFILLTFL